MTFDIGKFATEFKNTIGWMLRDKYGKKINDELQLFKSNKNELDINPDSVKALKLLVELIITQAWYYKVPEKRLFNINSRYEEDLKDGLILKGLRDVFSSQGYSLQNETRVKCIIYGEWKIDDGERVYIIRRKNEKLTVYYSLLHSRMNAFVHKHGTNFRGAVAKRELVSLVDELAPDRIVHQAKKRIQSLLSDYPTIKQFTEELYDLAKSKKTRVLGEKGRDNYLRDFGYWDRIPMDRHEMRFIARTGIYHTCSVRRKNDPLEKTSLHDALTRFCSMYLKGETVEDIDLGAAPGIVDIFIWSYCAKDRYNICGKTPRCKICNLKCVCLYPLTNIGM